MNDKYLIEMLNTLRTYRMGVWNAFLLSSGATVGLFLSACRIEPGIVETVFIFSGFALIIILILIIYSFNKKIDTILKELKNLEKKE